MQIQLTAPVTRGWERMRKLLFQPFDVGLWFVLGFSAWLANLANGGAGGAGPRSEIKMEDFEWGSVDELPPFFQRLEEGWAAILASTALTVFFFAAVLCALMLIVALVWVSSRGKFIFLDNVVHQRAQIVEPWKRLAALGNSLFLFRLVFTLASLAIVVGVLALAFTSFAVVGGLGGGGSSLGFGVLFAILLVAGFATGAAYLAFFLDAAVVPIMYRHQIGVLEAWQRFLPLLQRHLGAFILYGLFTLLLAFLVGFAIVAVGFMTCCVAFIPLMIPYLGTVLLLPIPVTYRAYTLEYLAQFGPEFDLLQTAEPVPRTP